MELINKSFNVGYNSFAMALYCNIWSVKFLYPSARNDAWPDWRLANTNINRTCRGRLAHHIKKESRCSLLNYILSSSKPIWSIKTRILTSDHSTTAISELTRPMKTFCIPYREVYSSRWMEGKTLIGLLATSMGITSLFGLTQTTQIGC